MLSYIGQAGGDYSFLVMMIVMLIPFILVCWLLIEVIRWLRRK